MQPNNASQSPAASAEDNTPRLDTPWLTTKLDGVAAAVPAVAAEYDGNTDNIQHLIARLAGECGKVWSEFKLNHCQPLITLIAFFTSLLVSWPTEKSKIIGDWTKLVEQANKTFHDTVVVIWRAFFTQGEQIEKLTTRADTLRRQIAKVVAQATGTTDGHIPEIRDRFTNIRDTLAVAVGLIAVLAIEILIGLGFFRQGSGLDTAFGLSTAVGALSGVLALLAAVNLAPFIFSLLAGFAYRQRYGRDGLVIEGELVHVFGANRLHSFIGIASLFLLGYSSYWLLEWRLREVAKDATMEGSLVATYVLLVIVVALFLYKLWTSNHLPEQLQKLYWHLHAELEQLKQSIKDAHIDDPAPLLETAKAQYADAVANANQSITDKVEECVFNAGLYSQLRTALSTEAWGILVSAFNGHFRSLLKAIQTKFARFDHKRFERADEARSVGSILQNHCGLMGDRELFEQVRSFDFTIQPPSGVVIVEFDNLISSLRKEVEETLRKERERALANATPAIEEPAPAPIVVAPEEN